MKSFKEFFISLLPVYFMPNFHFKDLYAQTCFFLRFLLCLPRRVCRDVFCDVCLEVYAVTFSVMFA